MKLVNITIIFPSWLDNYCVNYCKCLDHQETVATSDESQPGVQSGKDSSSSGEYY